MDMGDAVTGSFRVFAEKSWRVAGRICRHALEGDRIGGDAMGQLTKTMDPSGNAASSFLLGQFNRQIRKLFSGPRLPD